MKIIQVHPAGWGFRERNSGASFTPWGCNYYDPATGWSPRIWEQFDPVRVCEHLDHIQAMGANTIRVFSTIQNLLESPRRVRAAGIAKMMKMLALAEARGLRVIWSGPSGWEGKPDWWREDAPYEVCARDDLMAALETAWRGMGKAFRGHPALFAYELQNEPYAPSLPTPSINQRWSRWRATHAPDAPESLPKPPVREGERWLAAVHRFREDLATEYVRRMATAVRETDDTHLVTIGMHHRRNSRPTGAPGGSRRPAATSAAGCSGPTGTRRRPRISAVAAGSTRPTENSRIGGGPLRAWHPGSPPADLSGLRLHALWPCPGMRLSRSLTQLSHFGRNIWICSGAARWWTLRYERKDR